MSEILSYYYFVGETVDGDIIFFDTDKAVTEKEAKELVTQKLEDLDGGHMDAFYSETDEFAFDVEV